MKVRNLPGRVKGGCSGEAPRLLYSASYETDLSAKLGRMRFRTDWKYG
jgi:hypothetical protein